MRILGIDPSLRGTGYGVLEQSGRSLRAVAWGCIRPGASLPQTACLVKIHETLAEVIRVHQPDQAAVEGVIYVQNNRTAITLGAARGVALLAVAQAGLPVFEYPARSVKKSATGHGGAGKGQVGFMIRALLGMTETPGPDEADALAVALAHHQARPELQGKSGTGLPI
jgi:crossover junction endodeoxyribonuclease RuvC